MAAFRRAGDEAVNVFEVDECFLFKHYFEGGGIFRRLKPYYNNQQYRFEVPAAEFADVESFLSDHGYGLAVVDAAPFAVVVRKYTAHPENIFKQSVVQRSVGDYNCFLMTDQEAVADAVDDGAVRLTETNLDDPF